MRLRKMKLATPMQRLGARVLDIVFQGTPIILLGFMMYAYTDVEPETANINPEVAQRVALLVGLFTTALIIHIVQWILIASRGQSMGKMILHVKIVDDVHHKNAGVIRNLVLRTWLNSVLLSNILYLLVDSLTILRKDRKTLHDHIARTIVIAQKP